MQSTRNFKSFASSIETIYLVEASDPLRQLQKEALCGDAPMEETDIGHKSTSSHLGVPIVWVNHIRSLPKGEIHTNAILRPMSGRLTVGFQTKPKCHL
jgi:hypothetical protein